MCATFTPEDDNTGEKPPAGPRVLIVISRPNLGEDVSYQSVARHVLRELRNSPVPIGISVLRPPTWAQFEWVVQRYYDDGEPWDLIHFDCHGVYLNDEEAEQVNTPSKPSAGPRGYILFEKEIFNRETRQPEHGPVYVSGSELGAVLSRGGVRGVVLNACRSGYATALSSLAEDLIASGVDSVFAMQYSVYVDSAALLMRSLYSRLMTGMVLSEALSAARKMLAANAAIVFDDGRRLQDWPVPIVLEQRPVRIVTEVDGLRRQPGELDYEDGSGDWLPCRAQEDAILQMDRAFQYTRQLFVTGLSFSGKTALTRQFTSWMQTSAGTWFVIWSDATTPLTAERLAEDAAKVLAQELANAGYNWAGLRDLSSRMAAIRDILFDLFVIWVWDGIDEIVASAEGQSTSYVPGHFSNLRQVIEFLDNRTTYFVFTCTNAGSAWLGNDPTVVRTPSVLDHDAVQMLTTWSGVEPAPGTAGLFWKPVLEWAQGNLGALQMAARRVRYLGGTADAVHSFRVAADGMELVDAPEAELVALQNAGRRLISALSLRKGSPMARRIRILARHVGLVIPDLFVLRQAEKAAKAEMEQWKELLELCTWYGLASSQANGWFLHPLFALATAPSIPQGTPEQRAQESAEYVSVNVGSALLLSDAFHAGNRSVVRIAWEIRGSLQSALRLARDAQQWRECVMLMQGLQLGIRQHKGDRAMWVRLVVDVLGDLADLDPLQLRPGREEQGAIVMAMLAEVQRELGEYSHAERLAGAVLDYHRNRTAAIPRTNPNTWTREQRLHMRLLCDALMLSGALMSHREDPRCAQVYEEALQVGSAAGDDPKLPMLNLNLGMAFGLIANPPDFEKGLQYLHRSLRLRSDEDNLGKARCYLVMGQLHLKRWYASGLDTTIVPTTQEEFTAWFDRITLDLRTAFSLFRQAAPLLPKTPHPELFNTHYHAGQAAAKMHVVGGWGEAGSKYLDWALEHFHAAMLVADALGDSTQTVRTRVMIAENLLIAHRREAAREYAVAALSELQSQGGDTFAEQLKILKLVAEAAQPQ